MERRRERRIFTFQYPFSGFFDCYLTVKARRCKDAGDFQYPFSGFFDCYKFSKPSLPLLIGALSIPVFRVLRLLLAHLYVFSIAIMSSTFNTRFQGSSISTTSTVALKLNNF
ncbi:MAG: hypothetical protein NZ879_08475 [Archaeoglobaceae archaeon]|nr:hypothetical protein [Archaeoglobaceae archaeon]MDW8119000.1 hypothetical protein [Archaeoglobaceae archaeon]